MCNRSGARLTYLVEIRSTRRFSLFIQRERASKKRRVSTMPEREVGIGVAGPPESNLEIGKPIKESMRIGAVAGADGGRAILSQVKAASALAGGST